MLNMKDIVKPFQVKEMSNITTKVTFKSTSITTKYTSSEWIMLLYPICMSLYTVDQYIAFFKSVIALINKKVGYITDHNSILEPQHCWMSNVQALSNPWQSNIISMILKQRLI